MPNLLPGLIPPYADTSTWRVLDDKGTEYTVETDPGRWAQVPRHPRSVSPSKKMSKSHWAFVRKATGPAQAQLKYVVAAELDGAIYKVDGATRGLMWIHGTLPAPGTVIVTVYRCSDRQSLNDLYSAYHHHGSSETMYERVQGAYHENRLDLTSQRLRGGSIVDALHIAMFGTQRPSKADSSFDVYEAVATYADELRVLDSLSPRGDCFHTGVVAAALIGLRVQPQSKRFFEAIAQQRGSKRDGMMDPVENTLTYLTRFKSRRSAWIKANQVTLCARTIAAMDIYLQGEESPAYWSNQAPPTGDLEDRVNRLRQAHHQTEQ